MRPWHAAQAPLPAPWWPAVRGLVKGSPVKVRTRSGEELNIHFKKDGDSFEHVELEGNTSVIYHGSTQQEALTLTA